MANNKKIISNYDNETSITTKIIFIIMFIVIFLVFFFTIVRPTKYTIAKRVTYIALTIEHETLSIYKNKEYVFSENDAYTNALCNELSDKLAKKDKNCQNLSQEPEYNFTTKKYGAEILGLENPPRKVGENLVKEFLIDINGTKQGKNIIGVDVFPVKIYSIGMIAGRVLPVNCNLDDYKTFGIEYSSLCTQDTNINYLGSNEPFGFNVIKSDVEDGRIKIILHDVPFLRADCAANAGDMMAGDYCEEKQLDWLSACYEDTPCIIELNSKK